MRIIDVAASAIGLLILSPLFLVIGLWIKFDSPGPVFYVARRVGKGGRLFSLFKFRTMVTNAAGSGPKITTAGDTRVTNAGAFLRHTKLDELPQLFNVLKGDMALVGPRPEDPAYVALYTAAQKKVLEVRPGITGPASLAYRNEVEQLSGPDWEQKYIKVVMPEKLAIDLDYLARRNAWTDLKLIVQTILPLYN